MLDDGTIVMTTRQTEGRGQMGANWQSRMGQSLTFSVFKRFTEMKVEDQSRIAFAVSIGIQRALQELQIPEISIKWPNDIMSYQKKLCGVLIENLLEGDLVSSSIIGIGLNVNEAEFEKLPFATSMKLASGNSFNLDEVMELVSETVMNELSNIENSETSTLRENYETNLFRKDKVTVFEGLDGNRFNGIIKGVIDSGKLRVELEDESLETFDLKQIIMLL